MSRENRQSIYRSPKPSASGRLRSNGISSRTRHRDMLDKFHDECGVFGIFGHSEAANMTYLGLYALQHRGQESAGIAASDGERITVSRSMGYVADTFDSQTLADLHGSVAIGHVRYSTAGDSKLANAQPI